MHSFKKVYFLFLSLCLLTMSLTAEAAKAPWISARAAVVLDTGSGRFLYEKNPDLREYPASMTKMMTCILALENAEPEKMVTVSNDAAWTECTEMNTGYKAHMDEMLREMMLISDNGTAVAVAENIAGSTANFAKMMNAKAKLIGARHTHFTNPNGLPDSNHYSTARDMALIAAYGLKNWTFREIVSTSKDVVYFTQPAGKTMYCENTNELLDNYPGSFGIKTGWTRAAGGCLAAAAERNGRELIVVIMHSRSEDSRFQDAAALLDYGFSMPAQ